MDKIKHSLVIRIISIILITTFISLDISWAYPPGHDAASSTLAVPSPLQQNPVTAGAAAFQKSIFKNGAILGSACTIAKYLLEENGTVGRIASVLEQELGEVADCVDFDHVKAIILRDNELQVLDRTAKVPQDAAILIPYTKDGEKRIIEIALQGNLFMDRLAGYKWIVSDKYAIKELPSSVIAPSSSSSLRATEPPSSLRATEGSEAISISDPIAQIEAPPTRTEKAAGVKGRIFSIRAIIVSSLLVMLFSSAAFAGDPSAAGPSITGFASVFARVKDFIFTHPILTGVPILIVSIIIAELIIWRIFFPVSWHISRLNNNPRHTNALVKMGQRAVPELIKEIDSKGVVPLLMRIGPSLVVPILIKMLGDGDWNVYIRAIKVLREIKAFREDPRVVEALIKALDNTDAGVRKYAIDVLSKINDLRVAEALIKALDDTNARVRKYAIDVLSKIKDPRVAEALIKALDKALDDTDADVRKHAIDVLSKINDPRVAEALIKALDDTDAGVRKYAIDTLNGIKDLREDPRVVEALIKTLDDPDAGIRKHAIDTLNGIKDLREDPRVVEALIKTLDDPDAGIRKHAIDVLSKIKDPRVTEALIKTLDDPDAGIRKHAIDTLNGIKDLREDPRVAEAIYNIMKPLDPLKVPALIKALEDDSSSSDAREAAARELNRMCWKPTTPEEQVSYLFTYAAHDYITTFSTVPPAYKAGVHLVKIGPPAVPALIKKMLRSSDSDIRWVAAEALGEIKDARAVSPLIEALENDIYGHVRFTAAHALGEIKDPRAEKALRKASLSDSDPDVRKAAKEALEEIKAGQKSSGEKGTGSVTLGGFSIELAALGMAGIAAVFGAVKALPVAGIIIGAGVIGIAAFFIIWRVFFPVSWHLWRLKTGDSYSHTNATVESLINTLGDDSKWWVRPDAVVALGELKAAALALGEIKDPRAVEPLIKALSNPYIREAAVEALGKIKDTRAVKPLIEVLKDTDQRDQGVRKAAAEALGEIKDAQAVEPLIKALGDAECVCEAAARALESIGSPAVPSLIEALSDTKQNWSILIRSAAAKALGNIKDIRAIEPLIEAARHIYLNSCPSAVEALISIGPPTVPSLIKVLSDTDVEGRISAARTLGEIKDPRAVEPLIKALSDTDDGVRLAAALALGEIKDTRAVKPLIEVLKDTDQGVRKAAALALGELKDPRAVESLIKALSNPYIREAAAKALGEIKDTRAVKPLIEVLGDNDWYIREAAAKALGEIKDTRAVKPLIEVLKDTNQRVRITVAKALGNIKDTRAVKSLVKLLGDANQYICEIAIKALVNIGGPAVPVLREALDSDDPNVQKAATFVLGEIEKKKEIEFVLGEIKKKKENTPKPAGKKDGSSAMPLAFSIELAALGMAGVAAALTSIKDLISAHPVRAGAVAIGVGIAAFFIVWRVFFPAQWHIWRLGSAKSYVRRTAAEALGKIKDPRAVEPLIRALGDNDSDVWKAAAWALGEINDPRAVDHLIRALSDSEPNVRKAAAEALGEIKDPRAVEHLIRALSDSDPDVRIAAAEALGEIKDPCAVEHLIRALSDSDPDVRRAAVLALGEIKDPRAVEPLIKALGDSDSNIRWTVAWALGEIKDPRAVDSLTEVLGDDHLYVRKFAARALGEIKDPLIKALSDSDSDVRKAAVKALDKLNWKPKTPEENISYLIAKIAKKDGGELVKIGSPAVDSLIKALGDSRWDVRQAIAETLGEIKDPRAVEPLIRALGDNDSDVRKAAAWALGEIKDPRAVDPLIKALSDSDSDVRRTAAWALAKIKDPRAVDPLIKALGDSDEYVRRAVVIALGEIKGPRAVEALIKALSDTHEVVRQAAKEALGEIKKQAGQKSTGKKGGGSVTLPVFSMELAALGMVGFASVLMEARELFTAHPVLAGAAVIGVGIAAFFIIWRVFFPTQWHIWRLHSKRDSVVIAAAKALGKIGSPAVKALIKALGDSDSGVRRAAAAEALGKIKDSRAVDPLIKALGDNESYVRLLVAEALGEIKDHRAVEPLIKALGDSVSYVRKAAAEALDKLNWKPKTPEENISYLIAKKDWGELVKIGSPAVESLIKALGDSEWRVRIAAAEALGEIKAPRAVEPLIKLLDDIHFYARIVAAEALGEIKDPRAVESLTKASISDSSEYVRHVATKALDEIKNQTGQKSSGEKGTGSVTLPVFSLELAMLGMAGLAAVFGMVKASIITSPVFWTALAVFVVSGSVSYLLKRQYAADQNLTKLVGTNIHRQAFSLYGFSKINLVDKDEPKAGLFYIDAPAGQAPSLAGSRLFINMSLIKHSKFLRLWKHHNELLWRIIKEDLLRAFISAKEGEDIQDGLVMAGHVNDSDLRTSSAYSSEVNKRIYPETGPEGAALMAWFYHVYPAAWYPVKHLSRNWLAAQCRQYLAEEYSWMDEKETGKVIEEVCRIEKDLSGHEKSSGISLSALLVLSAALFMSTAFRNPATAGEALPIQPPQATAPADADKARIDGFIRQLGSQDQIFRASAAETLVRMGKDAVPALREALKDENILVRLNAAIVLRKIGPAAKDAVPDLIEALRDKVGHVRDMAADALVGIGEYAIPALVTVLNDEDYFVHDAAADILEKLNWKPTSIEEKVQYLMVKGKVGKLVEIGNLAVPALVKISQNKESYFRYNAIKVLYLIGPTAKDAIPALTEALKDEDSRISEAAAEALGVIRSTAKYAIPNFIEALKDKNSDVREAVAITLGNIGPAAKDAVPALKEALKDENADVREAAAEALNKIQEPKPLYLKQIGIAVLIILLLLSVWINFLFRSEAWVVSPTQPKELQKTGQPRSYTATIIHFVDRLAVGMYFSVLALIIAIGICYSSGHTVIIVAGALGFGVLGLGIIWRVFFPINWYVRGLYSKNPDTREFSARALIKIGPPAEPALMELLRNSDSYIIKRNVMIILNEIGNKKESKQKPTGEKGAGSVTLPVVDLYAVALGMAGVAAVFAGVKDFVFAHPIITAIIGWIIIGFWWRVFFPVSWYMLGLRRAIPPTRNYAAKALVKIGPPAVPSLIKALGDYRDYVRLSATKALGEIKDPRAIKPLMKVLSDTDADVRWAAAWALDNIGWRPTTQELKIAYLIAKEDWKTLVEIGSPAVEPLIKALGDSHLNVQCRAADALGEIKDPRAVDPLIKALGDSEGDVRKAAALALGEIKDPRVTDPLIKALGDSEGDVREAAALALGRIKDPRAVDPLIKALGDTNWFVQRAAAWALEEIKKQAGQKSSGEKGTGSVTLPVFSFELATLGMAGVAAVSGGIKELAAAHLKIVVPVGILIAIVSFLAVWRVEWPISWHLFWLKYGDGLKHEKALIDIGAPALPGIIKALSHRNGNVRWSAAKVLREMKDPRTAELLIKALSDSNMNVRETAALTLGELKDSRAIDPLIKILGDAYPGARSAAKWALDKIDRPAISPLIDAWKDKGWPVREAIEELLEKMRKRHPDAIKKIEDNSQEDTSLGMANIREGLSLAIPSLGKTNVRQDVPLTIPQNQVFGEISRVDLLIKILNGPTEGAYERAISRLESNISSISSMLKDPHDPDTYTSLFVELTNHKRNLREYAARALGRIKDPRLEYPLVEVLGDSDSGVREAAAEALDEIGWKPMTQKEQISYLLASMDLDTLGKMDSSAMPLIVKMLDEIDSEGVALNRLIHSGDMGPSVIPLLVNLSNNSNVDVIRGRAAMALGWIKNPRAVPLLIIALGDSNPNVRKAAAIALGTIKDPRAVGPLIRALGNSDRDVHEAATKALCNLKYLPAVKPLIKLLLGSTDPNVRQAAAEVLGEIRDPRAVDHLIRALGDSEPNVRKAATCALGKIRDPRAVDHLIRALGDSEPNVRKAAAYALGKIKDPCAVEYLIIALNDSSLDVRASAAYALGKIKDPCAVEYLIIALNDSSLDVRASAAYALGKIKDPRAVDPLIKLLDDYRTGWIGDIAEESITRHEVRYVASTALCEIGFPALYPLIRALSDSNSGVRACAAGALGEIKDPRAVGPLIRALGSDQHVNHAIAVALDKIKEQARQKSTGEKGPGSVTLPVFSFELAMLGMAGLASVFASLKALPIMGIIIGAGVGFGAFLVIWHTPFFQVKWHIWRLRSTNSDVRKAAINTLAKIGSPAVEPLIGVLSDPYDTVRTAAKEALVSIGSLAVPSLIKALSGGSGLYVRKAAAEVLGNIKDPRAVEPLIKALSDKNVCSTAAEALAKIGSPDAESLIKALSNSDSGVRFTTAESLDNIGWQPATQELNMAYLFAKREWEILASMDSAAVPFLIKALGDNEWNVRRAVAEALGKIKDPCAVEPLIKALGDNDSDVRRAAAGALGKIKDPRAVEPLIKALSDTEWLVSSAAAKALGEIKSIRAVEPLIKALGDRYPYVREAATEALVSIGFLAVPPLIKALSGGSGLYVREAAAAALGGIGDVRAVETLIKALGDSKWDVRRAAAEALGEIKDPSAVDPLIIALSDSGNLVREAAAKALGEIKSIRAVEPLIKALGDSEWNVRRAAAEALGKIKGIRAVEPLIEALDDSNPDVRRAAAKTLGEIKDPRATKPLIKALGDSGGFVHDAAAWALNEIRKKKESELKSAGEKGPTSVSIEAAARTLHKVRNEEASERRSKNKKGGSPTNLASVNFYAAVFGITVLTSVFASLEELIAAEPVLAGAAAIGLGLTTFFIIWRVSSSVKWHIWRLGSKKDSVVIAAAKALGKSKDARAVKPLMYLLGDGEPRVREAAARALGEIRDARAAEPLVKALGDRDLYVREAAEEALVKIGSAAAPALIKALDDSNPDIRRAAMWILGEINDAQAVEPLIKALGDNDRHVRDFAAIALGIIGDVRAKGALLKVLENDIDADVRASAKQALEKIRDSIKPAGADKSPTVDAIHLQERDLLNASKSREKDTAAGNLDKTKDICAIEPLRKASSDANRDVRRSASWALREIENIQRGLAPAATPVVAPALSEPVVKAGSKKEPAAAPEDLWPEISKLPVLRQLKEKVNEVAGDEFVHVELVIKAVRAVLAGDYGYLLSKTKNGADITPEKKEEFKHVMAGLHDRLEKEIGQDEERKRIINLMPMVHDIGKIDGLEGHWMRGAEIIDTEVFQKLEAKGHILPQEIKKTLTLLTKHHFSLGEIYMAANLPDRIREDTKRAIGYIDSLLEDVDKEKQDFSFIMTLLMANTLGDVAQGFLPAEIFIKQFGEIIKYKDREYFLAVRKTLETRLEASAKVTAAQLFDIVASTLNNRSAEFMKEGNKLISSVPVSPEAETVLDADTGALNREMTTVEIEERVERAIAAIENLDQAQVSPEIRASMDLLRKNLKQFAADSGVASLIVLARRAKRENQKLLLGLETDWIPAINIQNSLQRQAITALMKEIDAIGEALRSMGLDNVEVYHESGADLAGVLLRRADATQTKLHNIVVMASANTINSDSFAVLRNAADNDRPFLAGIDPTGLAELYAKYGESVNKQIKVKLASMFHMTQELAAGKEPPKTPMIAYYDKAKRMVIYMPDLPEMEPQKYEDLKHDNDAEAIALAAA